MKYLFLITMMYIYIYIYRVSHELRSLLRESVPYVKIYRYNPKHLMHYSVKVNALTAEDVQYAEMQDVNTFLWPLSP